jgi:hypothetical protein
MFKYLLLVAVLVSSLNVGAQVFKCKGADGKIQFSDTPCKGAAQAEIVKDRGSYVAPQDQYNAQQRTTRMQGEIAAKDNEKAAAVAAYQGELKRREAEASRKVASSQAASNDVDAVAACVRDVERRGASQNVKAEMLAACRTAGLVQRSTGMSGDAVKNCVNNVERTGATEKEKARQLATCHGGDVQPEPPPPPKPRPTTIMSCDRGGCWDDAGNRYNKGAGGMFRDDGKFCQSIGNMLHCN